MSEKKRPAELGGVGSPSKPDPKKGKLPVTVVGASGAVPSPKTSPLTTTPPDDPSLTAHKTLNPSQLDGPSQSTGAASDPIENSSQTGTQPLPASAKHIHGDELSEELRRACIEVEKELAHFHELSALPRGTSSKKLAKAAIRSVLDKLGVNTELRSAAILVCDARVDEYAKAPANSLPTFFGPCPCCPFSHDLWNPKTTINAPALSTTVTPPAPPAPPVAQVDSDTLAILRDPKIRDALASLPALIESLQGLPGIVKALPPRTAAVEHAQESLAERVRQTEETVVSLTRSKTSLLANFDSVSKTVTAVTERSTLISETLERAESLTGGIPQGA